jgi:hypothetical protein
MNLEKRINSFIELGKILREVLKNSSGTSTEKLNILIDNQYNINPWFTPDNIRTALNAIAYELTEENLTIWTNTYPALKENLNPVTVGVIMAGNIPLAGFHDFLSVLISGNKLIAKTSSNDSELIVHISELLCSVDKEFKDLIEFTEGTLTNFDVVIATGSNNSSRYFDYYFGRYPHIIRKNRNSIAIIEGDETEEELRNLGKDIFSYFGLGCRNVSKIYIPEGYDLSVMVKNWDNFAELVSHAKYANNYDFNKAVFLVNKEKFYDTGYLLLKESKYLSSPVSVLYYEFYKSQTSVRQESEQLKEMIQCVVGRNDIPFGKAQLPKLWDYADGMDTIEFLLKKNIAGIL